MTHRDIKPANLMIGERGEALVLDWGLAASAGEAGAPVAGGTTDLTLAGAVLGTPAYMSPEQARGERIDPRTDCWALGLVLHEILEGRRPGSGPLRFEHAPPELAAIVRRALQPDPAHRYPDAGALLDDLLAWRDHTRVSAYSYTLVSELRRLGRRYARELAVVGAALVLVAGVATVAGVRVVRERDRAGRAETELSAALAHSLEGQAWDLLLDEDAAGALVVAAEGLRIEATPRLRGLAAVALGRPVPTLRWQAQVPAEQLLAVDAADGFFLVVGAFRAQLWREGERILERTVDEGLLDGARFGPAIERYHPRTATSERFRMTVAPIQGDSSARRIVSIHMDGEDVYLGREDFTVDRLRDGVATVLPWRTPTRRRGWAVAGSAGSAGPAVGTSRAWLAEAEDGPALRDLTDGRLIARVPFRPVHHLAQAGALWVATSRRSWGSARVGVFDAEGRLLTDAPGLPGGNDALATVPSQSAVWIAGGGPVVRAFGLPGVGAGLALRHGGTRAVGARWDDGQLAVLTADGRLTVWDAPEDLAIVPPRVSPIHRLAAGPDGVWTVGTAGELVAWGPSPRVLPRLPDVARIFRLSDGTLLTSDRSDLIWLGPDGGERGRGVGLGEVLTVAEAGDLLATGGGHQVVTVLDRATSTVRWTSSHLGTDVLDVSWQGGDVRAVHLRGDVRRLAGADGALLSTKALGRRLTAAATSPDGRWLATASSQATSEGHAPPMLRLFDADLSLVAEAPLSDEATLVRWGPDGRLYTATFDGTVHVHDEKLALQAILPLERGQVRGLAFVDDTLLAAGAAGRVHRVPLGWLTADAAALAAEGVRRFGLQLREGELVAAPGR